MKNNILKIFFIFIFTCVSLHVFVLDLNIVDSDFSGVENGIYIFYLTLWMSMNNIDIIWFILGVFIFDYFYQVYFIDGTWKINKFIIIIISIIFSILILVNISLYNYHDFRMLYSSFCQIYKCLMVGMGYYFIIYAVLKKIFFINAFDNDKGDI